MSMEPKIIEIRTETAAPEKQRPEQRLPLLAGPTVWYALAGLSIVLSLYLFLLAHGGNEQSRHEIALFIGLWAPMFGILGLRAEILEVREDIQRGRRHR